MIYTTQDLAQWLGGADTPQAIYNTLVNGFNASTCILVAGVIAALFASFAASSVFLALGYFLRAIIDKELFKYTVPQESIQNGTWAEVYRTHPERVVQAVQNLFQRIGGPAPQQWTINAVEICDLALWKNKITNVVRVEPRRGINFLWM